jgi:hypothetical protein
MPFFDSGKETVRCGLNSGSLPVPLYWIILPLHALHRLFSLNLIGEYDANKGDHPKSQAGQACGKIAEHAGGRVCSRGDGQDSSR